MNSNSGNDKAFLDRLTSIVEASLGDENFGVSELAQEIGMSRSQLFFRMKSDTGKSVSQFIREIRLNKAFKLLHQSKMNVSEVSYQVGFGSPAYFNKCFHTQFGYPPGETKNHANSDSDSIGQPNESKLAEIRTSKHFSKLAVAFIILVALIGSYLGFNIFSYNKSHGDSNISPKSIVVLPLKNLSNDPEIQYLADGVMEDILTRLSYINGLVVKSRISSEKMGGENLTARELAKEIDVDYLLEGSLIPDDEKIRINVQLINAKEDKHIWANHFDKDLTEILPFITEVSTQITDQLEIILSPEEKKQLEKRYTESQEAYDLFLQGRYYHQLLTKEGIEKSIALFNQALAIDSNFCLAYAGLSDSYMSGSFKKFIPKSEGIAKSKMYAKKALSIEKELAEPHATLGFIATFFERDWNKADSEFKQALKINPGYARGYQLYSEYLGVAGRLDEARINMNKAVELQPMYLSRIILSQELYVREMKYDKAREEAERIYYMDKDEVSYHIRVFYSYLLQNKIPEAMEEFKKFIVSRSAASNSSVIDSIYSKSGRDGFIRFVINDAKGAVGYDILAGFYLMINEKDSAFYYLDKVANEYEKEYMYGIEFNPALKPSNQILVLKRFLKKSMRLTNNCRNSFFSPQIQIHKTDSIFRT